MEHLSLIPQIVFALATFFFVPGDHYLISCNVYYKKYVSAEFIAQAFCIVVNVVFVFVLKEFVVYVLAIHFILMGFILFFYGIKAKKHYFNELMNIIKENDLIYANAKEIKNFLLEKCGKVYFIDEIEKCLSKLNN